MIDYLRCSQKPLAILLIGSLAAGCAQMPGLPGQTDATTSQPPVTAEDEANLTPAQRQLRAQIRKQEEQEEAFNRTILQAVATGAVVGAVIGALTGDDSKERLRNAAIGGVAGGVVGALAGKYVAYKQQQYANAEDQLDSTIADVQQWNQQTDELLVSMRAVLAENKLKLETLRRQQRSKQISQEQMQRELVKVKADRDKMAAATKRAEERLTVFKDSKTLYQQNNPSLNTAKLDKEIQLSQARIDNMNKIVKDLSAKELG